MKYLQDKQFLKQLFDSRHRTTYARITKLNIDELPLETIEGKITSGSINVDGSSAIRRTFSLTMAASQFNLNSFDWGIETKIKLQIGIKNTVPNSSYPEVLWFPQGIYFITSLSTSINQTNISISISGKDKMAQLNGEIGGNFGQTTILDCFNSENGKEKYPIEQIIRDMLILVGNEKFHNIQIRDLEEAGLKLLNYLGNDPIYIIQKVDQETGNITSIYDITWSLPFWNNMYCYTTVWKPGTPLSNIEDINKLPWHSDGFNPQSFSKLNNGINDLQTLFIWKADDESEILELGLIYQINKGEIIGYENTPMVYNGDLIAQPADTICNILDNINNMLNSEYEYFYDLNGQFIFQKKKTYISCPFSPYSFYQNDVIVQAVQELEYQDEIYNNELITNYSINPGIEKIKNDYIIYGEKDSGAPIHLRYVLEDKPKYYQPIRYLDKENKTRSNPYVSSIEEIKQRIGRFPTFGLDIDEEDLELKFTGKIYLEGNKPYILTEFTPDTPKFDNFEQQLQLSLSASPGEFICVKLDSENFSTFLITEVIIADSISWGEEEDEEKLKGLQELYQDLLNAKKEQEEENPELDKMLEDLKAVPFPVKFVVKIYLDHIEDFIPEQIYQIYKPNNIKRSPYIYTDWRELIYQMAVDYFELGETAEYYSLLEELNPGLIKNGKTGYEQYYTDIRGFWEDLYRYPYCQYISVNGATLEASKVYKKAVGWNFDYINHPETLTFWLDFINSGELYDRFNVKKMGQRALIKQDNKIKTIFDLTIPPLIIYTDEKGLQGGTKGYAPVRVNNNIYACLGLASFPKSAKSVMETELSNGTAYNRSLNFSMIPNYSYEVNKKIKIQNQDQNLFGQFIINRLSYPLSHNGTMSVQATEVIQPLL